MVERWITTAGCYHYIWNAKSQGWLFDHRLHIIWFVVYIKTYRWSFWFDLGKRKSAWVDNETICDILWSNYFCCWYCFGWYNLGQRSIRNYEVQLQLWVVMRCNQCHVRYRHWFIRYLCYYRFKLRRVWSNYRHILMLLYATTLNLHFIILVYKHTKDQ